MVKYLQTLKVNPNTVDNVRNKLHRVHLVSGGSRRAQKGRRSCGGELSDVTFSLKNMRIRKIHLVNKSARGVGICPTGHLL